MAGHSSKAVVKAQGEFVLDYSELMRYRGRPCWFIGRGRVAGNTSPIPSGLHRTPRRAWQAAEAVLAAESARINVAEREREA